MFKKLVIVSLVLWGTWNWASSRPLRHGPGVLAPEAPIQEPAPQAGAFRHGEYQLTPLATFQLRARVLGREDYSLDAGADLSPMDLALGWGPMSDEQVLEDIDIRQSGRFFQWSTNKFPIPRREIERHSANMHLVPAHNAIQDVMESVREGQLVSLRGYLINVRHRDGFTWNSSLTRDDTGNGACELIWVEDFSIL